MSVYSYIHMSTDAHVNCIALVLRTKLGFVGEQQAVPNVGNHSPPSRLNLPVSFIISPMTFREGSPVCHARALNTGLHSLEATALSLSPVPRP